MIYRLIIFLACATTIYLLWLAGAGNQMSNKGPALPAKKPQTYWIRAFLWAIVLAFMFGDPIIVHDMNLALWGEAAIFFAVFFIQIFLDQRTRVRGFMAAAATLDLGAFYLVYMTVTAP